jgi:hypothetical protein
MSIITAKVVIMTKELNTAYVGKDAHFDTGIQSHRGTNGNNT